MISIDGQDEETMVLWNRDDMGINIYHDNRHLHKPKLTLFFPL